MIEKISKLEFEGLIFNIFEPSFEENCPIAVAIHFVQKRNLAIFSQINFRKIS